MWAQSGYPYLRKKKGKNKRKKERKAGEEDDAV